MACSDDDATADASVDGSADGSSDASRDGSPADSDTPDVNIDAPSGPAVILGTGITSFIPVENGDEMEMVMGPQGGWHVDLAYRLYNMDPMDMRVSIEGTDIDSGEALTVPLSRVLTIRRVADRGDHFLRVGDQAVFRINMPDEAIGKRLRLDIEVMSVDEEVASDTIEVVVIDEVP